MEYKALAIDLDGTLLIGESLPESQRSAVARAHAAGYEIIIATARWRQMAERVSRQIGFVKPIIACSGAQVHVPGKGDIFDHRLDDDVAGALYDICNAEPCMASVILDDEVIVKLDSKPDTSLLPAEIDWAPKLDPRKHAHPRIALIQGSSVGDTIRRELSADVKNKVNIYSAVGPSGQTILTITARAANKGEALIAACRHLNLDPGEVIAFGDSGNDIAMFKVAGASVAMGQADDNVKAAATRVTRPNTEGGVALVIERLLETGRLEEMPP